MARILPSAATFIKHQVKRFRPVAPPAGTGLAYADRGRPNPQMFIKRMPSRPNPRMVSSAEIRSSRRTGVTARVCSCGDALENGGGGEMVGTGVAAKDVDLSGAVMCTSHEQWIWPRIPYLAPKAAPSYTRLS